MTFSFQQNVRDEHNHKSLASIVFFVVVVILFGSIAFRIGRRYYTLNTLARISNFKQRIAIAPANKVFSESKQSGNSVDLGYAEFILPLGIRLDGSMRGANLTCVSLTNEYLSIIFLPPFEEDSVMGVRVETEVENSMWPSLWQVMFLSNEQFITLLEVLSCKASTTRGWSEVYSYATKNSVGLVRIGDSLHDRLHASVSLSATQGNRHIGFHVQIDSSSTVAIDRILNSILATFHFTVDTIPNTRRLVEHIHKVGMKEGTPNMEGIRH